MTASLTDIRDAIALLPKPEQARLLASVATEVSESFPGITADAGICGGSARIVRTRIPVWTLESFRRQGLSEGSMLQAFPTLCAEDLVNAWAYVRAHREESSIAGNEAD
jgi:uncharacterized protein (DUF433 family)